MAHPSVADHLDQSETLKVGGIQKEKESRNQSSVRNDTQQDVANTEPQQGEGLRNQSSSISRQDSGTAGLKVAEEQSEDVADTESSFGNDIQAVAGIGEFTTQEVFGDGSSVRGESAWWDIEPDVGRVAHGLPGRVYRLKGLGNSIIPQIAQEIGNAIIAAEGEEKKKGCPHN